MGTEKKHGNKEAKKAKSTVKGAKAPPKYMAGNDLAPQKSILSKAAKPK